jgi:hypothetical protein
MLQGKTILQPRYGDQFALVAFPFPSRTARGIVAARASEKATLLARFPMAACAAVTIDAFPADEDYDLHRQRQPIQHFRHR